MTKKTIEERRKIYEKVLAKEAHEPAGKRKVVNVKPKRRGSIRMDGTTHR
jgi:hypothetical protein